MIHKTFLELNNMMCSQIRADRSIIYDLIITQRVKKICVLLYSHFADAHTKLNSTFKLKR